ncbi:MAG TPA: CinA family nicotinamide mononucleotide deamidase-related protein [Anaerolineaceae bacterium]|nr:CinA family nicotinamide mononucleotide deamidase-related protein [Anaerolineaceae bacterium]HNZ00983.1 CinA family nicotinamide mononucleotide deamidase-related protein [Anaerolineaceae bacterium]HOD44602.1 CinA family nicotinamide mononucleotide deamidase-related protein [Anaerolineaceae bacterium]HOH19434.1 CinA family nicotinamide mononucleotide deamidase-related protein [Anaerolineaceae bacterium]HOU43448.1 CinA family nicotinamide mononucleotide deamidase-related protein [Anaerolineace
MPTAEIIALGTELLLGEIQDTNTRYIARHLRDTGIDLFRTAIIGDNAERIAQALREALTRAQIIITTGGLGPTVDDPTRQAVALAVNVPLEYRPELWGQIQARFERFGRQATENNKRQAYIPQGSIPVENLVGTAPAFITETGGSVIISLPGVPREMEFLMENVILPYLKEKFDLKGTIQALVLHCAGLGESQLDEMIGDLEKLSNPTVGLSAHAGQIDIRITAKANSIEDAQKMLDELGQVIRQRVGNAIYGQNEDTLESLIATRMEVLGHSLTVVEGGLGSELVRRLERAGIQTNALIQPTAEDETTFKETLENHAEAQQTRYALAVNFIPGQWQQNMWAFLITPEGLYELHRSYGGPAQMGTAWAVNTALDFVRRNIA